MYSAWNMAVALKGRDGELALIEAYRKADNF